LSRAPKRIVLTEGRDYLTPDGDAIELTTSGIERMLQAHAAGQDAVIEIDEMTFWAQLSSSSGIKGWNTLSAHLWFMLDRPVNDDILNQWAKDTLRSYRQSRAENTRFGRPANARVSVS
jgi:hypothetical protein